MEGIKPNNEIGVMRQMDEKFNQAILNFTWNMFKESSSNEGNLMISPISAYFALAMAANGADGDTKTEMMKALSAENVPLDDLNKGLNYWMNTITKDRIAKFSITNSIWYREGFKANKDFLQTNADYYSAYIRSLDFMQKSAPDTINGWVKEATNDKIDKIVGEINDDLVMYIINAIYFNGDWKYEFSANKTRKESFNAPSGKVETDFMSRRGKMDYLEFNGVTGVILPYLDGQFAFVGLLPEEGETPKDIINNLTVLDLINLMKNKEEKNIELSIPKFEVSYEDSLINELSNMGMKLPFEPYSADFSKMNESGEKDLFIGEIKHKTYIRVDEKGTEAAAVTSIGVEATSMPVEFPRLTFDRPFVYGIVDVTTGIPLFIGIMENPAVK
jgi:serpin B